MTETTEASTLPAVADLRYGAADESRTIDWRTEDRNEDGDAWRFAESFEFEHEGETYVLITDNSGASATHLVAHGEVLDLYGDADEIAEMFPAEPDVDALITALQNAEPHMFGAEGPMMNYWYPADVLEFGPEVAAVLVNYPLCVVEVDDEVGLALTGGGMDLSWEIAEAFVALGMFPPAFITSLPGMSGYRGANRVHVVRAMIERDKRAVDCAQHQIERFEALIPRLESEHGL